MNTNTAKFLFEGISADVVRYLVERNDMDLQEAISTFHNSETFVNDSQQAFSPLHYSS